MHTFTFCSSNSLAIDRNVNRRTFDVRNVEQFQQAVGMTGSAVPRVPPL